jgi:hypothetical protein|tara:strand:- start:444 stop:629 length:186 start_codon:yes stop_codon:yes gene_type:complete
MAKNVKFKLGDFVRPRIVGLFEVGDPPYQIEKIEDGIYTIVQKQGTYKHKLKVPKEKLNKL